MRRTALRRSTKRLRRTPLRKVSKKSERMKKYYALRKKWIEGAGRQFQLCQICLSKFGTDVHHRKSRRGNLLFDTDWWMWLCRDCHMNRVHGDVKTAKKNGWLVPFWR